MEKAFTIPTPRGELPAVLDLPAHPKRKPPLIIVAHGLFGGATTGRHIPFAKRLALKGFAVLRFSASRGSQFNPSLENFFEHQVDDLRAALDFSKGLRDVDASRIGLLGLCAGANAAFHASRGRRDVKAIVALSGWASPQRFDQRAAKLLARLVRSPVSHDELHRRVHEAMRSDAAPLEAVTAPLLLVQGTRDELVPVEDGERLVQRKTRGPVRFVLVDAGHFYRSDEEIRRASPHIYSWFSKWLKP